MTVNLTFNLSLIPFFNKNDAHPGDYANFIVVVA